LLKRLKSQAAKRAVQAAQAAAAVISSDIMPSQAGAETHTAVRYMHLSHTLHSITTHHPTDTIRLNIKNI
jgi:hypothetical protein